MRSYSEIETTIKRATKAKGFSWGISEEVGKNIRLLEMFGLPGLKNLNQYFKIYNIGLNFLNQANQTFLLTLYFFQLPRKYPKKNQ